MNKDQFDTGLRIRREVLGADYVDSALARADDFNRPFQEFVTEYCWGAGWGREGLDRKSRSMLNIAMLAAMNRQSELATHVRAGLGNGLTEEEVREILIQVTIYAGVPAGVEAFRTASTVLQAERKTD